MTTFKIGAIIFAVAGLLCAIVGAAYWLCASREQPTPLDVSIGDAPALHLLNTQVAVNKAAALNAKAAIWTGVAAVLSAIASILGVF
jgi:hypothetical protein